ncbi:unnamed protein product [Brassicogethes aeneus]|uniref:Uncharacterized protein n=1 Tax=Brassicogethes aeneus TaxID=1431903 RepID=A0A9P0B9W0_BRAAE|nr:unnamed protein product [Brassicogethes aeneus]
MRACVLLLALILPCFCDNNHSPNLRLINKDEINKQFFPDELKPKTVWAKFVDIIPPDNGGTFGDLITNPRQNGDSLLLRDVALLPNMYSDEQNFLWLGQLNGRIITSVRVLNFGRHRAYTRRIDIAGPNAQVIFGVMPLNDPRLLIEVYGF